MAGSRQGGGARRGVASRPLILICTNHLRDLGLCSDFVYTNPHMLLAQFSVLVLDNQYMQQTGYTVCFVLIFLLNLLFFNRECNKLPVAPPVLESATFFLKNIKRITTFRLIRSRLFSLKTTKLRLTNIVLSGRVFRKKPFSKSLLFSADFNER